jgi:hypothetical protein
MEGGKCNAARNSDQRCVHGACISVENS